MPIPTFTSSEALPVVMPGILMSTTGIRPNLADRRRSQRIEALTSTLVVNAHGAAFRWSKARQVNILPPEFLPAPFAAAAR
jgi:hypothetical protein